MKRWFEKLWWATEFCLILGSALLWLVAPEELTLNVAASVLAILVGLLLFYPRRVSVAVWLRSRSAKHAALFASRLALYAMILSLLAYLSWKFPWQRDLTRQSLNSLSGQSLAVVRQLPPNLKLTLFARKADWPRAMALLKLYQRENPTLVLEAVDPETRPQQARSAGVQDLNTVVVEAGEKRVSFILQDELSITNALLKFGRERTLQVHFLIGHGEARCDDVREEGLSALCNHLKAQNYEILTLDLQRLREVPKSADLVVIWGGDAGLLSSEVERLEAYLEKGGSLLWAYSPLFQNDHYKELRRLVAKWGLVAHNDLVIDRLSTLETQEATIPLVSRYTTHPVTKGFEGRTFFPLAASVEAGKSLYERVAVTELARTSDYPAGWAETDLAGIAQGKATFDDGKDRKGPNSIVTVAERFAEAPGERDTRVAVIGNDVFARNAYQNQTANMNLTLNILSWLAHDEGLVSLNRPGLSHTPVILSAPHRRMIFVVVVLTIPLLAFGASLLVYRRRRSL